MKCNMCGLNETDGDCILCEECMDRMTKTEEKPLKEREEEALNKLDNILDSIKEIVDGKL